MPCTDALSQMPKYHAVFHPDNSLKDTVDGYSKWANTYDTDLHPEVYLGPALVAQTVSEYFNEEKRGSIRVLDVAAGTGFLAIELARYGFRCVDALEPSEEMQKPAKEKQLYKQYVTHIMTDEPISEIKADTYDLLVCSGGHGRGHLPSNSLIEMQRIVKPGGLIILGMREEYLWTVDEYKQNMEPIISTLENEGKIQTSARKRVENWYAHYTGMIFVFKVL